MILKLEICNSYRDGGRLLFNIGFSPETSSPFMTLKLEICNSYRDGGRAVFKMELSPWRRAHPSDMSATVTRMEGGPFSKWGSRFGAADIRLINFQQLQGWRAGGFQNGALALAPRTFVLKVCNSYTDGGRVAFKLGFSP